MDEFLTKLTGASTLSITQILARLLLAFLLTSTIALLYARTYRGYGRPQPMAMVLVLVSLATAGIIMAIGDNLALSLGMVGALSIVRFRAAIKDNRDLAYLFWTLAVGLVSGAGAFALAITLMLFVSVVVLVLERFNLFRSGRKQYMVVLSLLRSEETTEPQTLLPGAQLMTSSYDRESQLEELTYLVDFADGEALERFRRSALADTSLRGFQVLTPEDLALG